MQSKLLPRIYERIWRPVGFTAVTGRLGSTLQRDVLDALHLQGDERVLDVACGPGNTTRAMLAELGPSAEMVGFDAAATMLRQAVAETDDERASYVHGDAHTLPFPDDAFDAVSCQAALHLMHDPSHALGEMVRVLRPGGRIALLVTCERGPGPLRTLFNRLPEAAGITMFGRDEFRRTVETAGLTAERQLRYGWFQLVSATKPEA
jgi:ubiquinone/menaquinone biosynthesis C-methylase UbiE